MTSAPLRMAPYSRGAKGLGHLHHNLALAHHLVRALPGLTGHDVTGLVIIGLAPGQEYRLPDGFDWLMLPGIKKSGGIYQPQCLRITHEDPGEVRNALLNGVLSTFALDLPIIGRYVYEVHQELRESLAHLCRAYPSARVVLGLREVLGTPATVQREQDELGEADTLRRLIDEVWVHGDAAVHDLGATGEAPSALEERMHYIGYLAYGRGITEPRDGSEASSALAGSALDPESSTLMITSGGCDGIYLLRATAQVRVPDDYRYVVATGPQLGVALLHQVAQAADLRTVMRRSWPGMSRHIQQVAAVIVMTGYNTVTKILVSETPVLLVPRETPRLEQLIRTSGPKEAGVVDLPRVTDLSVAALEDQLSELLGDQEASRCQLMG